MSSRVVTISVIVSVLSSASAVERLPSIPKTTYKTVDDFSYSPETAQRTWEPMAGSRPVSIVNTGGRKALRMPCNFRGTKIDRASWDCRVNIDLTMCKGLQFQFYCPDTSPVASFSAYFHSGNGWYRGRFDAPAAGGWTTVKIPKNDTDIEGHPDGWGKVDTIRISAWRGRDVDTEFYVAALGLFGTDGKIIIVRNDSAASERPNEIRAIRQYTDVMAQFLDRAGLSYTVLSDLDITADRLKGKELIILPHNPSMPDHITSEIVGFIEAGGKLVACYCLPNRLQPLVGIRIGEHIRQSHPGYFASIRPSTEPLPGLPVITHQASWNIHHASAIHRSGHVAAWWHSESGESTGKPAVVVSKNCVFLTHVLIPDDQDNKLRLLLAMLGNLVPEFWHEAAKHCLEQVGRFGPYEDYSSAERGIKTLTARSGRALPVLARASELRNQGLNLLSERRSPQAVAAAQKAHRSMIDAYCLAQEPLAGEHRAVWCHSAVGVSGMSWDEAIKLLADNGFTAILPNMLWAGVAFYESDVLPVAKEIRDKGDQIELCLAACKRYGVECHIWKVNYNMGRRTDEHFIARLKAQGRTQVNYDGSPNDRWLCPSHPENQTLEIESMLEVARKYDVDGLHFDYIRYPNKNGCFCEGCRKRFEKAVGRKVNNWPSDVRSDPYLNEQWLDFRRQQITAVVAAVAERAKRVRPDIKVSAAVFRNWPVDRDTVGQDWKLWCAKGYLDFVCPMDYTPSTGQFKSLVEQQRIWAGKVPCYPGIGLSVWRDPTDICKLIEQINATRELGTGGFTIFDYGRTETKGVLPRLGEGMTRKQ